MRKFGLLGYPLKHSFSKDFFIRKFINEGLDCVYENFEIPGIELLKGILQYEKSLVGLNVTIPYKVEVIQYLDELDPESQEAGAVNVISISRIGDKPVLKGYNTDIYGFISSLETIIDSEVTSSLILGTGGASKAVAFALKKLNIDYKFVSRSKGENILNYSEVTEDLLGENKLIVNTTPLGTYPAIDECPPIPYHCLSEKNLLFDLVYNPSETLFLKKGFEMGAKIKNGLEMLELQAEKSWEIWNRG